MAHTLNLLSTKTKSGTLKTNEEVNQFLLDYCATHPDATKLYKASDMILCIDSDAAYLFEPQARSRAAGLFYLGNCNAELMNGSIHILTKTIKHVCSSVAEAEIAALFMNARAALPLRVALEEMGHPQPATAMKTDNATADSIINGTVKKLRYYWLQDRV